MHQTIGERTRLEAMPMPAAQLRDAEPAGGGLGHGGRAECGGLGPGVIQQLDREALARPVEATHRLDDARHDLGFITHRQLHEHARFVATRPPRRGHGRRRGIGTEQRPAVRGVGEQAGLADAVADTGEALRDRPRFEGGWHDGGGG